MGRTRSAGIGTAMAACLLFGVTSPAVSATSNGGSAGGDEWPMYHGGFTHAGASSAVGPSSTAASWTVSGHGRYADNGTSPVVGRDGTIYLLQESQEKTPGHATRLLAISPTTHETLWGWTGGGKAFRSTPAVAPDGVVYVVTDLGQQDLLAIKQSGTNPKRGTTLWTLSGTDLQGSPTIGRDGTVYVESASSELYAVDPQNGHVYWTFTGSSGTVGVRGSPALSPDGTTVYLPSGGGDLYALSAGAKGGRLAWTYHIQGPRGGNIENDPAVGPDGTIYVATEGTYGNTPADIEAVNPDGTLKWAYISNGGFETTPAVTAAGQVVAGNDVGTVVAVKQSNGKLAWSYAAPGSYGINGFYNSSSASDGDGDVYIQNQDRVFALSPTGSVLWTAKESSYGASPALDDSGTLYVTGGLPLIAYESTSSATEPVGSS